MQEVKARTQKAAENAKNELLYYGKLRHDDDNERYHLKVCCMCDCFIKSGDERCVTLNALQIIEKKHPPITKQFTLWNLQSSIPQSAQNMIKHYYTVKCYKTRKLKKYGFLNNLWLSPKSYRKKVKGMAMEVQQSAMEVQQTNDIEVQPQISEERPVV